MANARALYYVEKEVMDPILLLDCNNKVTHYITYFNVTIKKFESRISRVY